MLVFEHHFCDSFFGAESVCSICNKVGDISRRALSLSLFSTKPQKNSDPLLDSLVSGDFSSVSFKSNEVCNLHYGEDLNTNGTLFVDSSVCGTMSSNHQFYW